MKVLKDSPVLADTWRMQDTCTGRGNGGVGCGARLELGRDDLRWFAEQEFPWRIAPAAVCFRCPVCGQLTDLFKSEWPYQPRELKAFSSAWKMGKEEPVTEENSHG